MHSSKSKDFDLYLIGDSWPVDFEDLFFVIEVSLQPPLSAHREF